MRWVIAFAAMLPVIDVLERWYIMSRDVDYAEGMMLPERWVCWGTCRAEGGRGPDFRYFILRLPSYVWMESDYGSGQGFYQRALLRFAGRWRLTYVTALGLDEVAHVR